VRRRAQADRYLSTVLFTDQRETDFVSARIGNYQSHPQWKILFDQLWVQ
jgi:hypothetical protein